MDRLCVPGSKWTSAPWGSGKPVHSTLYKGRGAGVAKRPGAVCAHVHQHLSSVGTMKAVGGWCSLFLPEDIHHAVLHNASTHVCRCGCLGSCNPCPAALGLCGDSNIYRCWDTNVPHTGGRRAGRCVPCARSRAQPSRCDNVASSSVWVWASLGEGSRWAPASPLATLSPLSLLVTRPSVKDALPCRVDQEGFVMSQADVTAVRCIAEDLCCFFSPSSPYLGYAPYE
jgi:hypothetical protein